MKFSLLSRNKTNNRGLRLLFRQLRPFYFPNINDQYGHAAGDRALRSFAGMITEQIGDQKAVAGRWGGEEFLIVCYGMAPQELYDLADRICRQTEKAEFPDVGHFPAVSVWRSFGREIRPGPRLNGRTKPFTGLRKPEETGS